MTFEEMLDHALAMLQRRGRVTYRALQLQFRLDDDHLQALTEELLYAHPHVVADDGRGLIWTGATPPTPTPGSPPAPDQERAPRSYTLAHLTEKILQARLSLAGERKQVTVLFADLKGSLELLADRDPEEARRLLDAVLERMMEAVHRYEGTVNQVMGDGIMALFGAPIAHEDHAIRACYAALAMQAALRRYSDEVRRTHGLAVYFRVGLNSGEVVVRGINNDLHMDYSAIGQTVHLAARMEQLAMPGSILLTPAALRLVEGLVQVHALGPIPVKGLVEPIEVAELVGVSALRRRLQAAVVRGLTRFVGRQQELAALRQALARAGVGHGQVVAVVGEAGVGKSRLLYEFIHSHHTPGWLVLESASVSYDKATPYVPVVDLLNRYAHVEEHDDLRTIRAKVTGQVMTLDAALQDVGPALLSLLDALPDDSPFLQLDPPQRHQHTFTALKRVLLHESQVQPVLLVFEDLHWIDTETQALLDSLVESLPTARLLLLVNYRPEYQHGWGRKTYYLQLRLDPLPLASTDELLQAVAEMPETQLRLGLTHLQAAEFLYETRLFPEIEYTFKHALTQQVAYETLLQERRRALHARIVEALEGLAGERLAEQVDRLAHHALWGEVWAKAVGYCQQAGDKAMARSAYREAVGYFEQALGALPLGEAQLLDGRLEEAHALADRALALACAHQERGHQAYALCLLGDIAARREPSEREQAEAIYHQALALADERGMRPLQAHCHRDLGTLYAMTGQREQARAELSTAIELYKAMKMTFWLPQAEAALILVDGREETGAG